MIKILKLIIVLGLIVIIFLNSVVFYIGKMHKGNQHPVDQNVVSVYRPRGDNLLVPIAYWENGKLIKSEENVSVFLSYEYENKIRDTGQIYTAYLGLLILLCLCFILYKIK